MSSTIASKSAVPTPRLRGLVGLMPFACLYTSFGATFSLLGTGAPLVLRAHGMPLGTIGWLQMITLPIGITFVWAPLVDRWRLPRLPHRLGWIVACQTTTVVLLLALSRGMHWPLAALFALALATSIAVATMDIALEALVVETVPRQRRAAVTTAKLVGSSLGTSFGIALVTALPGTLDLPTSGLVVAALDALVLLPILRYPEARLASVPPPRGRPASTRRLAVAARGAIIGLYFAPALMLGSTPSLALLDLGLSLPQVGLVTGPVTTGLGLLMMPLSGFALTRIANHRWIVVLALPVALAGLLLAVAMAAHAAWLGLVATLVVVAFEAGLAVPVFAIMYRWAEGSHPATDYAVLFGSAFLVSFPVRVISPMLAAALGWPLFFASTVPLYLAAMAILVRAVARTAQAR